MTRPYWILAALFSCQCALAAEPSDAALANSATPSSVVPSSTAIDSEKPRLTARRPLTVRARLDDGRAAGFRQNGGDQPAGDQQLRSPDRVQAENDRITRASQARRSGASVGAAPTEQIPDVTVRGQDGKTP